VYAYPLSIYSLAASAHLITVYPNPCNGHASIQLQAKGNQAIKLNITDIYGRIVYIKELHLHEGRCTLEVNLPKGIYVFVTTDAIGNHTKESVVIE
jgi:hypothetical protein